MDIIFKLIFGSKSQNDEKILKPIAEKTLSFEESIKKIKQWKNSQIVIKWYWF